MTQCTQILIFIAGMFLVFLIIKLIWYSIYLKGYEDGYLDMEKRNKELQVKVSELKEGFKSIIHETICLGYLKEVPYTCCIEDTYRNVIVRVKEKAIEFYKK